MGERLKMMTRVESLIALAGMLVYLSFIFISSKWFIYFCF